MVETLQVQNYCEVGVCNFKIYSTMKNEKNTDNCFYVISVQYNNRLLLFVIDDLFAVYVCYLSLQFITERAQ